MAVLSATAGGLFVSVAGAVVAVVLLLRAGHAAALHRPTGIAVLGFAALAGCLFTVIGRVRRTARDTTPARRATVLEAAGALRRPMPAAGVISGAVAANAATVVALFAALEAFGVALPVVSVATVGLIAISLDSIGPLQGAPGLVDAFLAAGFLALGGSPGAVVAAVMVFRLLTLWLRVAVGAAVARRLERRLVL